MITTTDLDHARSAGEQSGTPLCGRALHAMTPDNTYTPPGTTQRHCRACRRAAWRRADARARNALRIVAELARAMAG